MRTRLSIAAIALFFLVMHALVLKPHGFFSGDQGAKFLQARAFAQHGPLNPGIEVRSRDIDPEYRFQDPILRNQHGQLVATFSWLLPMLTAPFLALAGLRGLYVIPALSVLVTFLAAAALGRRLSPGDGLWSAWTVVLAAPVLVYGLELWEHAPAAAGVLVAAALLVPAPPPSTLQPPPSTLQPPPSSLPAFAAKRLRRAGRYVLAGAVIALAALFREEAALALPALVIARAVSIERDRWKELLTAGAWTLAGAAAVFALTVPVNLLVYGSPLPLHLTSEVAKTSPYWDMRRRIFSELLLPSITPDSLLYTWLFVIALVFLPFVSPDEARRPVVRFLGIGALLVLIGTLAIIPSPGGAQWSPRYLFGAAPLFAVLASAPARPSAHAGTRATIVLWAARVVLLAAVVVQAAGILYLVDAKARNARITDRLASLAAPEDVVITDVPWFPQVTATLLPDRRILLAWSPAQVDEIATRAAERGFRQVSVVTSMGETHYSAPRTLDASAAGCLFTRTGRQSLAERALILHRYGCESPPAGVVK